MEHLKDNNIRGFGGNPKKQDKVKEIQAKGEAVYIHRFAEGINKDQVNKLGIEWNMLLS